MNKYLMWAIGAIVILVGGFFALNTYIYNEKQGEDLTQDYKEVAFTIEGENLTFKDNPEVNFFGNELSFDLDADGDEDKAYIITRQSGGSGTFYYVVAALKTENGYLGTEAYFIGDRVSPQNINVSPNPRHKNVITVNYADRAPGEPMSTSPSVGKSVYLKLDPASRQWGIVEPNFEGESDPKKMALGMKTWVWVSALYNDGREIRPKTPGVFTIKFENGKFSSKTDCNSVGGTYVEGAGTLTFADTFSTLMYCEGSQEAEFTQLLLNTSSYHFSSQGELILDLKFDSGSVVFK